LEKHELVIIGGSAGLNNYSETIGSSRGAMYTPLDEYLFIDYVRST